MSVTCMRWRIWVALALVLLCASVTVTRGFLLGSSSSSSSSLHPGVQDTSPFLLRAVVLSSVAVRHDKKGNGLQVPIQHIESHVDWMELLDDDDYEDETHNDTSISIPTKIVAVTFHATWCRYCLKFQKKWNRKVVQNPVFGSHGHDSGTHEDGPTRPVQFASVEFGSNRQLCQSLQVHKLPTVQLYHDGKLLTSFPCPPKEVKKLPDMLMDYLVMDAHELEEQVILSAIAIAAAKENSSRSSSKKGSDEPFVPEEIMEHEEEAKESNHKKKEPALFQRKRDRLKKKLFLAKAL